MKKYILTSLLIVCVCFAIAQKSTDAYVIVLGVAQDGGYPHAGCEKKCCTTAWANKDMRKNVVSLALVDAINHKWWLFEATPDIKTQLQYFRELTGGKFNYLPDGIFITHAHIGHYTGLMQLGREVMNTKEIPVHVLPKMKNFLKANGPWSQLVSLKNISLVQLDPKSSTGKSTPVNLSSAISVQAFTVPHRDEYSETAGFKINTGSKKYLFIPDIDKWEKWDKSLLNELLTVEVALLDGTFYEDTELPGRSIAEVPHPFVPETIKYFQSKEAKSAPPNLTSRIYFIHFNHTNPLLWDKQKQEEVKKAGFNIATQGQQL